MRPQMPAIITFVRYSLPTHGREGIERRKIQGSAEGFRMPRANIFALDPVAQIQGLIDRGLAAPDIAKAIGCTVGTLRVKCSQLGIGLRRRQNIKNERRPRVSARLAKASEQPTVSRIKTEVAKVTVPNKRSGRLIISLPKTTIDQMRRRAALRGRSAPVLAALLLKVIAQEDLYDAVLDGVKHETST
jgi:hypothetical protein